MKTLAHVTTTTNVTTENIFNLWKDIDNWAEFDHGIEWAKKIDDFKEGGHYELKPKGGPKVRATIQAIIPNERFIDVSHLLGANLTFDHSLTTRDNETTVEIIMTINGPLAWFWAMVLGKGQQEDLEASTANLIAKAESK